MMLPDNCRCGQPIDQVEFDNPHEEAYGFCASCLVAELSALKSARDDYAKNAPIEVMRLEHRDSESDAAEKLFDEDDSTYLGWLRSVAVRNALSQRDSYQSRAEARGESVGGDWDYTPNEDGTIVPFLRHNATNYEDLLAGLPRALSNGAEVCVFDDDDDSNATIRDRVHQAIAKAYPEIADNPRLDE